MQSYWYGVTVTTLPETFDEGVVLNKGFEDGEPDVEQLEYVILARVRASSADEARTLVSSATESYGPTSIVMIADLAKDVVRDERRIATSLSAGDVRIKDSFIGFKKDNDEARSSAFHIIDLAIRKKWWEFWR